MILDWSRLTVARGHNRLELSRTQLRLLDIMIAHRRQAICCEDLADCLWPRSPMPHADKCNAIKVEMRGLRRRLYAVGLGGAIVTVKGGAYRLSI
jgi:two-component system response regulator protein GraR